MGAQLRAVLSRGAQVFLGGVLYTGPVEGVSQWEFRKREEWREVRG